MKKHLRFLYRYLFNAGHWRRWLFNTQTLLVVVVSGVFLVVLFTMTPRSVNSATQRIGGAAAKGLSMVQAAKAAQTQPALETPAAEPSADGPAVDSTPAAPVPTPTRTPFPAEFYENAGQTGGITLAGLALVLIIFVGVWSARPRMRE